MPGRPVRAIAAVSLILSLGCTDLPAATLSSQSSIPDPRSRTRAPAKPASIAGELTIASVGDLIYARPLASIADPDLQKLLDLVRAADVAIGNQEGVFFDLKDFGGYAPGSPYILIGPPEMAKDLKAIGIDMISTANNHSNDWGIEGLLAMDALLDQAGIIHVGDGATLAEAQAAKYLDTAKGRIALIATASTFKPGAKAQDAIDGMPSRPGISTLRLHEINIVTADTMRHLRAAVGKSQGSGDLILRLNTPFAQPIEKVYRVGTSPHFSYEMNTFDHSAILKAIQQGKRNADLAVFTIHAHENADGMDDRAIGHPADFLVRLSHDAIDAGADIVMGGGPHSMRGIEIYRGKPIFYGLAAFLFKGDVVLTQEQQTEHYGLRSEERRVGKEC